MKRSRSALSLALVGAVAAAMSPQMVQPASSQVRVVESNRSAPQQSVPSAAQVSLNRSVRLMPDFYGLAGPMQVSQFYRFVPRFRGYRNGRPRGRRSYRSHQRT